MKSARILITGSAGLIGSEAVLFFDQLGYEVHGIDNNSRARFFGADGDTRWNLKQLTDKTRNLTHHDIDIRNAAQIERLVHRLKPHHILHCAAQPAHDFARNHPVLDFHINVTGTMNLLEACRKHCPESVFVFCSSSKVYGSINSVPWKELETRFVLNSEKPMLGVTPAGISEDFPLTGGDGRGVYGTGKAAADLLVQEYGKSYGIPTVSLRGNCMTGAGHSPVELHGFLAYLARCFMEGRTYHIFGYKGKQVRDIIHSYDFVSAMHMICVNPPPPGTVYNLGGGHALSISILEAIDRLQSISGRKLATHYVDRPRHGDHRVYVSDTAKFQNDYPDWRLEWTLDDICRDLVESFDDDRFLAHG